MKRIIIISVMVLFGYHSKGQVEDSQVRATLFPIGVGAEFGLGEMTSIDLKGGLFPSFGFWFNSEGDSDSYFELSPYANTSVRKYYNFEKREEKGKKTSGNSANYVAFSVSYIGESIVKDDGLNFNGSGVLLGPVWGLQRTYDSNIYLDLQLGLGAAINTSTSKTFFSSVGAFGLGYAFN